MNVLERDPSTGKFEILGFMKNNQPFHDIHVLSNGDVLAILEANSNLVKYGPDLDQKYSLPGINKIGINNEEFIRLCVSNNELFCAWTPGDSSVEVIDITTFARIKKIDEFYKNMDPLHSLVSEDGSVIVGLGSVQNTGIFMIYGKDSAQEFSVNEVLKDQSNLLFNTDKTILAISSHPTDQIIFGAGSTNYSISSGQPIILAFKSNLGFPVVDEIILENSSGDAYGSFCINAIDLTRIIVGTHKSLFLISWNGRTLEVHSKVEDLHSCRLVITYLGMITGIGIGRNFTIFTSCSRDNYVAEIALTDTDWS